MARGSGAWELGGRGGIRWVRMEETIEGGRRGAQGMLNMEGLEVCGYEWGKRAVGLGMVNDGDGRRYGPALRCECGQ